MWNKQNVKQTNINVKQKKLLNKHGNKQTTKCYPDFVRGNQWVTKLKPKTKQRHWELKSNNLMSVSLLLKLNRVAPIYKQVFSRFAVRADRQRLQSTSFYTIHSGSGSNAASTKNSCRASDYSSPWHTLAPCAPPTLDSNMNKEIRK